ncbi:MAG TPA: wax ester/triacylglycerol synthase domain-containing protein [Sporichthyaceae bacterium]|nr:wax ester/triacylglycerol synthase domain-containing protein [Sporichthyaceae bacterium]
MKTLSRTFRRFNPPPTREQKIALVVGALVGLLGTLVWLQLDRPSWWVSRWAIGAGLAVATLAAFTAPRGGRWRRLGVSGRFAGAANAAMWTTAAVAAVERGEHRSGHLALGAVFLLCILVPVLMTGRHETDSRAEAVVARRRAARRLSGLDSAFYSGEYSGTTANCLAVLRLRPRVAADGSSTLLDVAQLRHHVAERLGALPAFRWRVVGVPFGLGHPVYVDDADFDITHHVEEHTIAAPGTADVLDAFCAEQAGRGLDRRRPLWRLTLVHGLADGRQTVVLTVHHCVTDGFALLNTLQILVSDVGSEPTQTAESQPVPSARRLLVEGLADQARAAHRLPALVRATRTSSAAAKAAMAASAVVLPSNRDTAMCRPYRPFTGRKTLASSTLDMADVTRIKDAAGVTINDVVLVLVAGAMRAYLSARDSLPTPSLVANVPVGLDRANAPRRTFGNRVGFLKTTLGTDLTDPWQRLITIGAVTARAKRVLVVRGPHLLDDWLDQIPPWVIRSLQHYKLHRMRHDRQRSERKWNLIVSHVREQRPMGALAGSPVETAHFIGPADEGGTMVNFVVASHGDRLFLTILCVEAAVPQPRELIDGMHRALEELLTLANERAAAGAPLEVPA